jgi:lipopolysaccharide biosynthesis regulator YciM
MSEPPFRKPSGSSIEPWALGVDRFSEGDFTGALVLLDDCAEATKTGEANASRCRAKAAQVRQFLQLYQTFDDLDAKALQQLLELDKEITDGGRSNLGRTAGLKLASELCKVAMAARAAGKYDRAAELAKRALEADPSSKRAKSILEDLKAPKP